MNKIAYKKVRSIFCIVCTLILVGCAVPQVALDQAAVKDVKKVAIIPIKESQSVMVTNTGGPAALFGAIGGVIQASTNVDHGKVYTAAINAQGVKMAEPLSDTLLDGLQKKGLEVVVLTGQYPKLTSDGKSDDYTDIKTDADVILQVWFGYTGYFSGMNEGYKPWLIVHSKLLDAHTKKELYHQSFSTWRKPHQDTIEFIAMDGKFEYDSFDALMSHVKESIEPFLQGEQAIARQLLKELQLGASGKMASNTKVDTEIGQVYTKVAQ